MTLKNTDRGRIIFKLIGPAALVLFLLITAWAVVAGVRDQSPGNNEGETMKNLPTAAAKRIEIPALDAAAPAQFETATFALG